MILRRPPTGRAGAEVGGQPAGEQDRPPQALGAGRSARSAVRRRRLGYRLGGHDAVAVSGTRGQDPVVATDAGGNNVYYVTVEALDSVDSRTLEAFADLIYLCVGDLDIPRQITALPLQEESIDISLWKRYKLPFENLDTAFILSWLHTGPALFPANASPVPLPAHVPDLGLS